MHQQQLQELESKYRHEDYKSRFHDAAVIVRDIDARRSKLTALSHDLAAHGVKVSGVELDLAEMMKRKDSVVSDLTKGIEHLLKKNKVVVFDGFGSLVAPGRAR